MHASCKMIMPWLRVPDKRKLNFSLCTAPGTVQYNIAEPAFAAAGRCFRLVVHILPISGAYPPNQWCRYSSGASSPCSGEMLPAVAETTFPLQREHAPVQCSGAGNARGLDCMQRQDAPDEHRQRLMKPLRIKSTLYRRKPCS